MRKLVQYKAKKNETPELIQGDNDCGLIPGLAENILKYPSALFADCGSVDENKTQLEVHSVGAAKLSEHSKNVSRGGSYCFSARAIHGTRMSATGRISSRERGFRRGSLLISGRLMKCKDHG